MKILLALTVLFQVALCAPPSEVPSFQVQDFYGRTIDLETPVKEVIRVTVQASDSLLSILDAKIAFILCKVLRVCANTTTPDGRSALDEVRLEDINDAILVMDNEDPVEGRLLHLLLNEDYQTYLTDRIRKTLCSYGSKHLCADEADAAVDPAEAAVDPDFEIDPNARFFFGPAKKGEATPTLSLAIRKLFSHLAVKVGFVACKLGVWCPDEHKAFKPVKREPVINPDAVINPEARR